MRTLAGRYEIGALLGRGGMAEVHEGFSNALRRLGDPQDVSGVVRFLLSEAAGFVTGEVIRVDGGLS